MREYKFRMWDATVPRMVYDEFLIDQQTGKCFYFFNDGKVITPKESTGENGTIYDCGEEQPMIMQFTGLKDKNGKDIYEGDIIRYVSWHAGHIGAVSYDTSTASFGVEYMDVEYHYFGKAIYKDSCEVIGNIHENPELLK